MGEKKQVDNTSFEIRFYEGIIARSPYFIEALSALGDLYTRNRLYHRGLEIDERLYLLRPRDPIVLYNLACSYSLLNEKDKALRSIKQAINCGYDDFEFLESDSDLYNLRSDPRFVRFFARIKNKQRAGQVGS